MILAACQHSGLDNAAQQPGAREMISSKRKKAKKPVKPQPSRCRHSGRQPDWDVSCSRRLKLTYNRRLKSPGCAANYKRSERNEAQQGGAGLRDIEYVLVLCSVHRSQTISDWLQAKRHAAFVSKNRVQVPDKPHSETGASCSCKSNLAATCTHLCHQSCMLNNLDEFLPSSGPIAGSGGLPTEGFWGDIASLDFGAVAKDMQAMQLDSDSGKIADAGGSQTKVQTQDADSDSQHNCAAGNPGHMIVSMEDFILLSCCMASEEYCTHSRSGG